MGKIEDALQKLEAVEDPTARALEVAGLISTVFKLRQVVVVLTGELAFSSYANTTRPEPEVELAPFAGKLTPRLLQEVMGGQLRAEGELRRWTVAGIPVRFQGEITLAARDLCRDLRTEFGVVKLVPAEEITADRILAAVYPGFNPVANQEALTLLTNGLVNAFKMDWAVLGKICHQPDYHVGEELAQLRVLAKQGADAMGLTPDQTGELPRIRSQKEATGELPPLRMPEAGGAEPAAGTESTAL
jgi:hypothetical protein